MAHEHHMNTPQQVRRTDQRVLVRGRDDLELLRRRIVSLHTHVNARRFSCNTALTSQPHPLP